MKKSYLVIATVLLALVVGSFFLGLAAIEPNAPESNKEVSQTEAASGQVITFIDFGNGRLEEFDSEVTGETTAYETLKVTGLDIGTEEFSFGILVDSIDGVRGGTDNKYWLYYVNGIPAKVSVDHQAIGPGDEIIWRFEKEDSERDL